MYTHRAVINVPVLHCITLCHQHPGLCIIHYMVNIQLPDCDRYYNSSVLGYSIVPTCELLSFMSGFITKVHSTDQRHFCLIIPLFSFELLKYQEKCGIISGEPHILEFF